VAFDSMLQSYYRT